MRIESDEGFVVLFAQNSEEAELFVPIQIAINAYDKTLPACITDNREETDPKDWIIGGVLTLTIS